MDTDRGRQQIAPDTERAASEAATADRPPGARGRWLTRPREKKQATPTTEVTVEVSANDPAVIEHLHEALTEIRGVFRVRLVASGNQGATFVILLDAAPNPTESLLAFRESLEDIPGIMRVQLRKFSDDQAAFTVTASMGFDSRATAPYTVVCAWCGRTLTPGGSMISHGICATCASKVTAEVGGEAGLEGVGSDPGALTSSD